MRSLDKDELLAQLAEKERRIKERLDTLRDEGDQVTRSLADRCGRQRGRPTWWCRLWRWVAWPCGWPAVPCWPTGAAARPGEAWASVN